MNKEFFEAVKLLESEKGISAEYLYEKIADAIIKGVKHDFNGEDVVFCDINEEKQNVKVYAKKEVVEVVENEFKQMSIQQAQTKRKSAKIGDFIEIPIKTKDLGRIVASTSKGVIRQGIRDAEKLQTMKEFESKNQELLTAKVSCVDPINGNATVEIGKTQAILPKAEQVPGEVLVEDSLIKIFVVDVKNGDKGPKIMISRSHPGLVKRLFETEVPEIFDGTIEIKAVAREAGSRTKIAVYSKDDDVDAVGSCIGSRGVRVNSIVDALNGEKIDIVPYSEDPASFVAAALAPSDVVGVEVLDLDGRVCRATVPDGQLSLAIGNKGQNVRLAARLTSWKIDIKPESDFYTPEPNVKEEKAEETDEN